VHSLFEMIVINVYSNTENTQNSLHDLQLWVQNLITTRPNSTVIICGDFNTDYSPIPFFKSTI
jgi:hypothetical protein